MSSNNNSVVLNKRGRVIRSRRRVVEVEPAIVVEKVVSKRRRNKLPSRSRRRGIDDQFPMGMKNELPDSILLPGDEYIGEVLGSNSSTTAVVQTFAINPGQSATFPWLSLSAPQWESYRFEMLEFYYKSEVSAYATGGQTGKVVLVCDYDAADTPPTTKKQAEDTKPHDDAMAYQDLHLPLDPKRLLGGLTSKFVRPGAPDAGTDIRMYDSGNVSVLTLNNGTTGALGELRVRYRCRFMTPVLEALSAPKVMASIFHDNAGSAITYTTGVQATMPLAVVGANYFGFTNTSGSLLCVQSGFYYFSLMAQCGDGTNETFSASFAPYVNGVQYQPGASAYADPVVKTAGTATGETITLSANYAIALGVGDTISFDLKLTGAAGTLQAVGSLVITLA